MATTYSNTNRIPAVKIKVDTVSELNSLIDKIGFGDIIYLEDVGMYFKNSKTSLKELNSSVLETSFSSNLTFHGNNEVSSYKQVTSNLVFSQDLAGAVGWNGWAIPLWFNGTATLTIPGTNASIFDASFTDGAAPVVGSYDLYVWYRVGGFTVWNLVVSDQDYSPSIVLLQDDFTGVTIDTGKWNKILTNNNGILFAQNNQLNVTADGVQTRDWFLHYIESQNAYSDGVLVYQIDLQSNDQTNAEVWTFGLVADGELGANPDNRITFQRVATAGKVYMVVRKAGSNVYLTEAALDLSTVKKLRIVVNGTAIAFEYWNGAAWASLGTDTQTFTNDWRAAICQGNNAAQPSSAYVYDNFYLSNDTYVTETPA